MKLITHADIDFSHLLAECETHRATESIILMTDRALSILHLVLCQLDGDNTRVNDATLGNAMYAAMAEIENARATAVACS